MVAADPAPTPQAAPPPAARPAFSSAPFDDLANERAPVDPSPMTVKKTPIVPDFDN